jgi:hypothetical protein
MAIQQRHKFPSKVLCCRDEMQIDMVAIHQHGLKSTTSAGVVRDVRDMRERRDTKFWPEIPKPRTSDL